MKSRRNYQKELDRIIEGLQGERPRLLLHACCAPCSSYPVEYLSKYFDITILYYNPNIFPAEEYEKRAAELMRMTSMMEDSGVFLKNQVKAVILPYQPEVFYGAVKGYEDVKEGGERCRICYRLRLLETVKYAAENGFDYFTTSLSISPLKNCEWLNEIGEELSSEYGVKHLPSDFKKRNGYLHSVELSKEYGMYRQNFCGCVYSMRERNMVSPDKNEVLGDK